VASARTPVRISRSIRALMSSARNWQQNRASMLAGCWSRTGAAFLHGFEQVVAAFEVGLVAVGGRHRGVG